MRVCYRSVWLHQTQQMKRSPLEWDKVRDGKLPGHRLEQHESKCFLYELEARGEAKTAWLETLRVERSAGLVLLLGPYPQLHSISY